MVMVIVDKMLKCDNNKLWLLSQIE